MRKLALFFLLVGGVCGQQPETFPRQVYASPWQGGLVPAVACDKYDGVKLFVSMYIEYVRDQREQAITNGQNRYLHDPVPKPNPEAFGCSLIEPGTPMTMLNRIYGVPVVKVRLRDGTSRTGVTPVWAILGAPPPCTGDCPAQLIKPVHVEYPDLARRAGIQGSAIVSLTIDEQGYPRNIKVESNNLSQAQKPPPTPIPYPRIPPGKRCPFGFRKLAGGHNDTEPGQMVCVPSDTFAQHRWEKHVREQRAAQDQDTAQALHSDPTGGLDQNAIDAVSQWHFKPATKAGNPVPMRTRVEIEFTLLENSTLPSTAWKWR